MKVSQFFFAGLVFGFLGSSIFAQGNLFDPAKIWGHAFVAPGAATDFDDGTAFLHLGVGFAAVASNGLGGHAELGYAAPFEAFSEGVGVFSPGLLYAFNHEEKTVPFVVGGYSLLFRTGTASGIHFGMGVNHWFNEHLGITIEGRDHVVLQGETFHILEARVGILFR